MSHRGRGLAVGAAVAVAFLVELMLWGAGDRAHPPWAAGRPWWITPLGWCTIVTPIVGYTVALALTLRRSTRSLGLGLLLGLTAALPVALIVGVGLSYSHGTGG